MSNYANYIAGFNMDMNAAHRELRNAHTFHFLAKAKPKIYFHMWL